MKSRSQKRLTTIIGKNGRRIGKTKKKIKYLKKSLRGPHYYRRQIPLTRGGYHHVYEPIPYEFGTPEFFTEYARINEKFEKGDAHVPLDVVPK